ncbi:MAG: hypothetical protein HWE34_12060 [Methylocystaceae bacterium]|nr:hypothetical protein [Methylocystaceae bacterium]
MFRKIVIFFAFLLCLSTGAQAKYCPEKIAVISGDPFVMGVEGILQSIYRALGCKIEFVSLPAKRGILYFNNRSVDGEIYRLSLVENAYNIPFVRSSVALLHLKNALWENPDREIAQKRPMGYVRGIKWHDEYAASFKEQGNMISFGSEENMFQAYERGSIGSFLTEKQSVDLLQAQSFFKTSPKMVKVISDLPLYHYLNADYADFMKAFSAYLVKNKPFKALN